MTSSSASAMQFKSIIIESGKVYGWKTKKYRNENAKSVGMKTHNISGHNNKALLDIQKASVGIYFS